MSKVSTATKSTSRDTLGDILTTISVLGGSPTISAVVAIGNSNADVMAAIASGAVVALRGRLMSVKTAVAQMALDDRRACEMIAKIPQASA